MKKEIKKLISPLFPFVEINSSCCPRKSGVWILNAINKTRRLAFVQLFCTATYGSTSKVHCGAKTPSVMVLYLSGILTQDALIVCPGAGPNLLEPPNFSGSAKDFALVHAMSADALMFAECCQFFVKLQIFCVPIQTASETALCHCNKLNYTPFPQLRPSTDRSWDR